MPALQFNKAFGIARDLKVFLYLRGGVTRGAVPPVDRYEKLAKELRIARQKNRQLIKEQRREIEKLRIARQKDRQLIKEQRKRNKEQAQRLRIGKPSPPLERFKKNYTSQFGEDGIIERALELIPNRDCWCVEFGAWDGKELSNTYTLIERRKYSAVLIEADTVKFASLQKTHHKRSGVICFNRFVEFEGPDSLDSILSETPIPWDFDVLSIDIDGNDYHIWDSLTHYRPKIVVIEFNPTIPNEVDFVQPKSARVTQGASLLALSRLADAKGYRLVHATTANGIFVEEGYFSLFGIQDNSIAALRAQSSLSHITYFFHSCDGKVHLAGNNKLVWHGIPLRASQLQILPRGLRTYPPLYNRFQRLWWKVYRWLPSAK